MPLRSETNPRIAILREEVEKVILTPLRKSGWVVEVSREHDAHSSLEVTATREGRSVGIGIVYSSATDNKHYKDMAQRVEYIFFHGTPYMLDSFTRDVNVPIEPLGDFLPVLFALNKEFDPDCTPKVPPRSMVAVRRITEENPLEGILNRLQQFTSINLAKKLVSRRAEHEGITLSPIQVDGKALGIAFAMRNALDYITLGSSEKLNKRILGLYYGSVAFAFAEMLAAPSGPSSLDEVEQVTKFGHGLYTYANANGGFADFNVGVLATGFLPQWLAFLGYDIAAFPKRKPRTDADLTTISSGMRTTLGHLFSSMPEIEDLFADVFGTPPGWIIPVHDTFKNHVPTYPPPQKNTESTYALLIDRSRMIQMSRIESAGWPIAEIKPAEEQDEEGNVFSVRVDHIGHEYWWGVMPTHRSPFTHSTTLIFPTLGGMCEYRTIAITTLYALSIMVRYMPSAWRRIEGGDEDQYLALIKAALSVWERILPEQFLQSIANERIVSNQPGALF